MPDMDWLQSEEFKRVVRDRAREVARDERLDISSSAPFIFTVYLDQHADENMSAELIKEARQRRTERDALHSVDVLVKEAALIVRRARRETIEIGDIQEAMRAKFCMVWPFCGKGK